MDFGLGEGGGGGGGGGGGALHMLKCVWARNWEAKKCLFQIFFFSFFACISKGGLPGKALFAEGLCPPAFKIWDNLVVEQWQLNRGHVRSPAKKSDIGQRFPQLDVTLSGA